MDPLEKAIDPSRPIRIPPRVDVARIAWGLGWLAVADVVIAGLVAGGAVFPVLILTLLSPPMGLFSGLVLLALVVALNAAGVRMIIGRPRIWLCTVAVGCGLIITAVIVISGLRVGSGNWQAEDSAVIRAAVLGGLAMTAVVALGMPWRSLPRR